MPYSPTQRQIKEETARIRKRWTKAEQDSRAGVKPNRDLGIKVINTRSLTGAVAEEIGDEAAGWQYIDKADLKRQAKRKKTTISSKDEEDESFQASVVVFGNSISKGAM
jgi:hypothetical protein